MGIKVEFNPVLALRKIEEAAEDGGRNAKDCIPNDLHVGDKHPFLKKVQRNYWLLGEIPLVETRGNQHLSRPKASIRILEATHFVNPYGDVMTKGLYEVMEVFDDDIIHFEGFAKVEH
jgi:hypothetical protein